MDTWRQQRRKSGCSSPGIEKGPALVGVGPFLLPVDSLLSPRFARGTAPSTPLRTAEAAVSTRVLPGNEIKIKVKIKITVKGRRERTVGGLGILRLRGRFASRSGHCAQDDS